MCLNLSIKQTLIVICKYCASAHSPSHADSLRPHGLQPSRLLCPWDFPGENTGVGCHLLLQGILPTQGLNPSLLPATLHWQVDSSPLDPPGQVSTLSQLSHYFQGLLHPLALLPLISSHPVHQSISACNYMIQASTKCREFPGGPLVKIQCFHCHGPMFDPWMGN